MRVSVGDVRLFVDIDGAKLVPDGRSMRERPTIVMLHGDLGFDHTPFKALYARLTEIAQVVYYDHPGNGRSEDGPPGSSASTSPRASARSAALCCCSWVSLTRS